MRVGPTRRIAAGAAVLLTAVSVALPRESAWAQDATEDASGPEASLDVPAAEAPVGYADPLWQAWADAVLRLQTVDYSITETRLWFRGTRADAESLRRLVEQSVEVDEEGYEALAKRLVDWYVDRVDTEAMGTGATERSARVHMRADSYRIDEGEAVVIETPFISVRGEPDGPGFGVDVQWDSFAWKRQKDRPAPRWLPDLGPGALLELTGLDQVIPPARFVVPPAGFEWYPLGRDAEFRAALARRDPRAVLDCGASGPDRKNRPGTWKVTFERAQPYTPVAVTHEEHRGESWSRRRDSWLVPDRVAAPLPRLRVALDAIELAADYVKLAVVVQGVSDPVLHDPESAPTLRLQLPVGSAIEEPGLAPACGALPQGWHRHWAEVLDPPGGATEEILALRSTPLAPPRYRSPIGRAPAAPMGPYLTRLLVNLDTLWPWFAGVISIVVSCVVLSADPDRSPLRRRRKHEASEQDAATEASAPDDERHPGDDAPIT